MSITGFPIPGVPEQRCQSEPGQILAEAAIRNRRRVMTVRRELGTRIFFRLLLPQLSEAFQVL